MEKRGALICSIFVLCILFSSGVFAFSSDINNFSPFERWMKSVPVTGSAISASNPSLVQQIYLDSSPATVKILVYVDYEFFLPNITHVDYSRYFDKLYYGYTPSYDDILIESNPYENFFGEEALFRKQPMWYGTGFFISPDGDILTNAHVAIADKTAIEEYLRNYYLLYLYSQIQSSMNYNSSYTNIDYLSDSAFYNFVYYNVKVNVLGIEEKVIVGVDDAVLGTVSKEYIPEIVAYEGGNYTYIEEGLDWALLKINGNNFDYLQMGNSDNVSIGQEIVAVGFPGVSEYIYSGEENLTDYTFRTDIKPTLSTGYVSSIKPIGKGYKSFQADMSISGGNSGGPALNMDGNVIGIVTYGYSEYMGGNYNYILRINDIKDKISDKFDMSENLKAAKKQETEKPASPFNFSFVFVIIGAAIIVLLAGILYKLYKRK